MSTPPTGAGGRRAELLAELARAAQRSTTDGILFHQAVADRLGLHVTDLRCLNLLAQAGPLTAGELGEQTGLLTTGAVTRMVDRLERAGYVRRQIDPRDRRRVIVQPVPERLAAIAPLYQGMAAAWGDLLAAYGEEQLALFLELFERMHRLSRQELARLQRDPGP
jgi:DNA-binding MarR family transcriptional regulator